MTVFNLEGRRALVTGASSGVGEAVARKLAEHGARVAIAARRADRLTALAEEIGACLITTDLSQPEAPAALIEQAQSALGGLDILINNAGAHHRGDFADQEADALATMIDVNLRAPVVLSRLALPYLEAGGAGTIINVGSVAGRMPVPGSATYSASKYGLRALTYALAEEFANRPVSISVVSPGPIATDFILSDIDAVTDLTFSQPMSTPEQIADDILACIIDGKTERTRPASTRVMTTIGALFPAIPRWLRPALAAKGRRAKARYRRN